MPPITIDYEKDSYPERIFYIILLDIALAEGTPDKLKLQNIRLAYTNTDVCLLIDGSVNSKDTIIALTRDFIIHRIKEISQPVLYSESMDVIRNVDKIYDIIEVTKDYYKYYYYYYIQRRFFNNK